MIIYNDSTKQFIRDVNSHKIAEIILNLMKDKNIYGGGLSEYASWSNSLMYMRDILNNELIPEDSQVAIEYQIPQTSKRVDFLIAGSDGDKDNIVIVELKQWQDADYISDEVEHSIQTFTGGAKRLVAHPSYQAYSYARLIGNTSEVIQSGKIDLFPAAYLHNYLSSKKEVLTRPVFEKWLEKAPLFVNEDGQKLTQFIAKYIKFKNKDKELLFKIDHGRLKPSKALQDSIVSMMKGNQEFMLIDDQITAFDVCVHAMKKSKKDGKKRTIIIEGGPGTGKSVLAMNLLQKFIKMNVMAQYITKNSAPRNAFTEMLSKSDIENKTNLKALFRSPFKLNEVPMNKIDALIVDEAHRLVKKMYGDFKGENQIKEVIQASLVSIFLIDEDQRITTKDIGSIESIKEYAKMHDSTVFHNSDLVLKSQFRCNGSDGYIQLVNNILQIGEYMDVGLGDLNYDLRIFDDPNEMRETLREINESDKHNNKARMVAGYCYPWNIKNKRPFDYDIALENDFFAKWNLPGDNKWAINKNSFEEVGCIHTAQGLEFDYAGVIIGKDLRYDSNSNQIIIDQNEINKDDKSSGIRSASKEVAEKLIKNTYKTLLTRGQKGCFIYCEDKELTKYLINKIK
jgi:DUF2075 family protein